MPDKIPDGFLSKPDALEKYQKPERTFQRRLAKALRVRNEKFLNHLLLVTSDGKIQEGIEVEHGVVQKLKEDGLYPVWYLEETWFANQYDRKPKPKTDENPAESSVVTTDSAPVSSRPSLDRAALVSEIESLQRELKREREHNNLISTQLTIKDEQIKAASKLALESNVREKEMSSLLKQLAQRIPNTQSGSLPTAPAPIAKDQSPRVVNVVPSAARQTKKPAKSSASGKTHQRKKSAPAKKKKKKTEKKKDLFPTFRKFLNRQ